MIKKELIILIKEFKFRLDYIGNEEKILCYDKRTDQFFTMKKNFYETLCLLRNPVTLNELHNLSKETTENIDFLLKGLNYRSLLRKV